MSITLMISYSFKLSLYSKTNSIRVCRIFSGVDVIKQSWRNRYAEYQIVEQSATR